MNRSINDREIKILMYHRIVERKMKGKANEYSVCIDDFRNQLKILEIMNFTPITFLDYKLYMEDKLTLPKKPIILTFDDGYRDTFELAIPALLDFDMRAVIFVMGNRKLKRANWDDEDENIDASGELMSNDQILTANSMGFEIGSHTMNHKVLTDLSEFEIREEIMDSMKSLESILGKRIHSIAYPYGCADDRVRRIARESGFLFGCGVYSGPPGFGVDFYNFRRLSIDSRTGIPRFLLYLATPYQYAEWVYGKWKNRITSQADVNNQDFRKASLFGQSIHE